MLHKEHRTILTYFLGAFAIFVLVSCTVQGGSPFGDKSSGGSSTTGGDDPQPPQPPAPLAILDVGTVWEGQSSSCTFTGPTAGNSGAAASATCDAATTFHRRCTVAADTPAGTNITCDVSIPEAQLYYSSIRFKFNTNANCPIINWQPYYYLASKSSTFSPMWSTSTVDCSKTKSVGGILAPDLENLPADCFSGPSKIVQTQFPKFTGFYAPLGVPGEWNAMVPSANSTNPELTNRWATNDLSATSRACMLNGGPTMVVGVDTVYRSVPVADPGDGFVCGHIWDYSFSCEDLYYKKMFTVTIKIHNLDDASAAQQLSLERQDAWWSYNF